MKAIGKFRMASALIVLAAVGYIALLFVENLRDARYRTETRRNLKIIGLALHNYHDAYGSFPPAYVRGPDGKPWHSWRTLILPFIGAQNLYDRYRFDEPWDGPHNRELFGERIENYRSSLGESENERVTTYMAVVSRRSMWPAYFSMKSEDVRDGTANTLLVVQNVGSDVIWSEPRDLNEREMLQVFDEASGRDEDDAYTHALFVDGSARAISAVVSRELLVSLMTPRMGQPSISNERWPPELLGGEDAFAFGESVDPSSLPATIVTPVLDVPIDETANAVYCATLQIAWDQLRIQPDKPIDVFNRSQVTDSLNSHPFPLSALSKDSYFAEAVPWIDETVADMKSRFQERFPHAQITFPPPGKHVPSYRLVGYLQKSMPYVDILSRNETPLVFRTGKTPIRVTSFGWEPPDDTGFEPYALKDTVSIGDYKTDNDFIVVLQTNTAAKDESIIAKIPAAPTLGETWNEIEHRLRRPREKSHESHLRSTEFLQIPIVSMNLKKEFDDLANRYISPCRIVASAGQSIRFRLDERGAELISDAYAVIGEFGEDESPKPRRFIVDRPFLLALREKDAEAPYFVAWIANGDLMEPFVDSAK